VEVTSVRKLEGSLFTYFYVAGKVTVQFQIQNTNGGFVENRGLALIGVTDVIPQSCLERETTCLHWSTKILFHEEKMSVSEVFLDAEFIYISRVPLSPTTFALHQTM
jgi:hypothetical protein